MKISSLVIGLMLSTGAMASTDFNCTGKDIEVSYVNGNFSYNNGRTIDVAVGNERVEGKTLTVSGVSRGLVFAGGGSQTVTVAVNLKTKKGNLTILTKTFYRRSEVSHRLTCTL